MHQAKDRDRAARFWRRYVDELLVHAGRDAVGGDLKQIEGRHLGGPRRKKQRGATRRAAPRSVYLVLASAAFCRRQ